MYKLLHKLDAEKAHNLAIWALHKGLTPTYKSNDDAILASEAFGLNFPNPIGLAAGFDKNAYALPGLSKLGFGFIEVGSVTPRPQEGNKKPRIFRLPEDQAIINRLGFNNAGIDVFLDNLQNSLKNIRSNTIIGINIGANKDSESFYDDYLILIERSSPFASYITVNISSPNTPGLRDLQKKEAIQKLLKEVLDIRNSQKRKPPLLVKIAPDLSEEEIYTITDVAMEVGIDGIIATNTTTSRDGLKNAAAKETGGLSGRPLTAKSTDVISKIYKHSRGKLEIIGVGGVFTGQDAFDKIAAGASLVQVYTGFIYEGPKLAGKIKAELSLILKAKGFTSIKSAIGSAS